jgi:predicted anti-sigma-YlaC factor YlaD
MMDVDRCSEWRALASCRLDGELDELQDARLERHLIECAACRTWSDEIAALAIVIQDSSVDCMVEASGLRPRALRRRLVHSAMAASAASAAAVAAFAVVLPGAISLFSSGRATAAAAAPCASCIKKQVLTNSASSPAKGSPPVHVRHPLEQPGLPF